MFLVKNKLVFGSMSILLIILVIFHMGMCRSERYDGNYSEDGPSFIIIGTKRGGTTSLTTCLLTHHSIFSPKREFSNSHELRFFTRNKVNQKTIRKYRSIFKKAREKAILNGKKPPILLFEKTPSYLCKSYVPEKVHSHFPELKVIVMLRNPVDRVYSEMVSRKFNGKARNEKEIDLNEKRQLVEELIENSLYGSTPISFRDDCEKFNRGNYYTQLQSWFEYYERDQVMIIKSEDFFEDPKRVYEDVLRFLNVSLDDYQKEKFDRMMKMRNSYEYLTMTNDLRRKLMLYYKDSNQLLYELLGRDFGWEKLNQEKLSNFENQEKMNEEENDLDSNFDL